MFHHYNKLNGLTFSFGLSLVGNFTWRHTEVRRLMWSPSVCPPPPSMCISSCLCACVSLHVCVTGSSPPLCRWWRLVWSQMTPLYSQSDVSYRLYDSTFDWLSESLLLSANGLAPPACAGCLSPLSHLCRILIGWSWGCLIFTVHWDDCGS